MKDSVLSGSMRGSIWVLAALAGVLLVGWAGGGGCAGADSAQVQSEVDALTQRVQTLEGRVRKLEGGGFKAAKGKGKSKGKSKGKAKAEGEAGAAGAKAKAPADPTKAKAKGKAKAAPPADDAAAPAPQ